jgi:hypothetical protein
VSHNGNVLSSAAQFLSPLTKVFSAEGESLPIKWALCLETESLPIERALYTDIEILTITERALHMDRGVKNRGSPLF